MFNIASFLEKFKTLGGEGIASRRLISRVLATEGIVLEEKEIKIRDGIAYVHAHPALKNQIYLKKTLILNFLNADVSGRNIKDLR